MSKQRQMLRSEAAAVRLNALTLSQVQAFSKLSKLLDEALEHSSRKAENRQFSRLAFVSGAKGTGKSSLVHTLEKACVVRDGIEGEIQAINNDMGKKRAFRDVSAENEWKKRCQALREALKDIPDSFVKEPRGCRNIRWLKPLSLDPLPQGTNLLAAVLARIEVAVNDASSTNRQRYGSLDPYGHMDRARHQLTSLKTEAVKALEGNLEFHSATMDPTTHAIAATEAELSKVTLRERLDSVLDSVLHSNAEEGRGEPSNMPGMFVMFIDDLNLCPSKAIEVVKLAHLLSSRRLFYLFLGEIEDLTKTLFFKVQGDLKKLLGVAERQIELRKIETDANEIAFSLIRKLIPENQRIHVSEMTVPEALDYDCMAAQSVKGAEKFTLENAISVLPPFPNDLVLIQSKSEIKTLETLWNGQGNIKIEGKDNQVTLFSRKKCEGFVTHDLVRNVAPIDAGVFQPSGWFRVGDLLDKHVGHGFSQAHEVIYDGANTLRSTPRHIGDALHLLDVSDDLIRKILSRVVLQKNAATTSSIPPDEKTGNEFVEKLEEATYKITDWLFNMFKGHIGEDGQLTVAVQRHLRNCAEKHKMWELSPGDMQIRALAGDALTIHPFEWRNTIGLSPTDLNLNISRVLRFDIEVLKEDEGYGRVKKREYVVLGPRSRPAFKLLHDFMLFSGTGVLTNTLKHENLEQFACAKWTTAYGKEELCIPWTHLPWRTFWRGDIFRDLWNHTFETARSMTRGEAMLDRTELSAFLALSWMSATLITLDAQPGDLGMFDCQDKKFKTPDTQQQSNNEPEQSFESATELSFSAVEEWGQNLLGTKLFETEKDPAKIKSAATNWANNVSAVIDTAFEILATRIGANHKDIYTQAMSEKLTEIVLLCMPEAGPMMFFTRDMASLHSNEYEANAFGKGFLDVANSIAKKMLAFRNGDKIKAGIYFDIMRVVREKRLKNFGQFATTYFGIGLLLMNEEMFRGLSTEECRFGQKGDSLTCFKGCDKDLLLLFGESRPSLSSFYASYHAFEKFSACSNDEKKELDEWLEGVFADSKRQELAKLKEDRNQQVAGKSKSTATAN